MNARNIPFDQMVNYLVSVFSDQTKAAEYTRANNPVYFLLGGWAKNVINAPANKAAFVAVFGSDKTAQAEQAARDIITARAAAFESSQYFAHTIEADAHQAAGQPAPVAGAFVWALDPGLTCENGTPDAIENLFIADREKWEVRRVLCKVEKVYFCTAEDMTARNYAPGLVCDNMPFSGGMCSDDYEIINYQDADQMRTVYTVAAALVDPSGRWCLIDSEGYDYSRYILLPLAAREIFADLYTAAQDRERARQQEKRDRAQSEAAAILAEYNTRADRWAVLMEDLTAARAAFDAAPWQDKKQHAATLRALKAGQRRNIAAMVRAAFPGLKISVTKEKYNNTYCVAWCNGPTVDEMRAAVAFDLFEARRRRWDATDENGENITADLSSFAARFMCDNAVKITTDRTQTAETPANSPETAQDAARAAQVNNSPADDQTAATGQENGQNSEPATTANSTTPANSPETAQDAARAAQVNNSPADDQTAATGHENSQNDAPHVSLQLCDMPGGVYVEGSTRATWCNRRRIKQHGGRWNKTAGRWEATEPAAVAALRAWFRLRETA